MKVKSKIIIITLEILLSFSFIGDYTYKIAVLKYDGGGDWYANPTAVPNLIKFCNDKIGTRINPTPDQVHLGSEEIFNYPFLHMTGHGNVIFSADDVNNIKDYLQNGGFLHIDDNYGMDKFIRRELKKVFPDQDLIELPFSHPIFKQSFKFNNGLPKIHEHDNKPPQAFGLFHEGKLVVLYTYECDLGDGWEDAEVHNDTKEARSNALKMGANIVQFAFNLGDNNK